MDLDIRQHPALYLQLCGFCAVFRYLSVRDQIMPSISLWLLLRYETILL